MPFGRIHRPAAVRRLSRLLESYCQDLGISTEEERSAVAATLLANYEAGITDSASLRDRLEAEHGISGKLQKK